MTITRVDYFSMDNDDVLTNQLWSDAPAILINADSFLQTWPLTSQLRPCGRCRCRLLQSLMAALALLFHYGTYLVYVEFEEHEEVRYPLWKWLCCGCCRRRPSYLFESLQQNDSITKTLAKMYIVPRIFSGTNDLFESCRSIGCPLHTTSVSSPASPGSPSDRQQHAICTYVDLPCQHLSHMGRYRWFLAGNKGCGVAPHTDPGGTCAWNAVIVGSKRWIFFPPNTPRELLHIHPGSDAASWFREQYPTVVQQKNIHYIEVVHQIGEIMYVKMCEISNLCYLTKKLCILCVPSSRSTALKYF